MLFDIVYFPIWWYSKGFLYFMQRFLEDLNYYWQSLAISVWAKNLFVPMYGQYDWLGRIISVFIRLANVIFRSLAFFIIFLFLAIKFALILFFPLILVYLIVKVLWQ